MDDAESRKVNKRTHKILTSLISIQNECAVLIPYLDKKNKFVLITKSFEWGGLKILSSK